ncbi:response regulator transcription factor [Ewingella americana]|uniref:response regulator transcription factor n=1 Tax=Ewingella americana TaxID=41202 RepID=UPI0012ADB8BE|nr:response regulator transcription factor [Ewingella americana]MRT06081.1 response regulator [Ewingella americana]
MIKILVVNSAPLMSLSLSILLKEQGYDVVGKLTDGFDAFHFIKSNHVDLVLSDINLSSLSGLELVQRSRNMGYDTKFLIMGDKKNWYNIRRAMKAGANGYLSSNDAIGLIKNAVSSILADYNFFPSKIYEQSDCSLGNDKLFQKTLTLRELQVLRGLTSGKRNVLIAEEMKLSFKTVSAYKCRIMSKLKLSSTVELLDYARNHKI